MPDYEITSKTWPGALRELQRRFRRNDKTTRKILKWLKYAWLPRCQTNAEQRLQIQKDFHAGRMSAEEHGRLMSQFEDKFRREELMTAIGLDYVNRRHYQAVSIFFRNERKLTAKVLERFTKELRWQELKAKGKSIEDIWWAFIQSCLSWGVFPVYADPDDEHYHKLLTFADWRFLFESFRKRFISELSHKTELIKAVEAEGAGLPLAEGLSPIPIPSNPFLSLPEPRVCPDCGMPFSSDKELIEHHRETHR